MRQTKAHLKNKFFRTIVAIHIVLFIFLLSPLPLTKSIDEQLYPLLLVIFSFMVSVFQTMIKAANEEKPLSIPHKIGLSILTIFAFIILFIAYYGTSGNLNDKLSILSVFVVTSIIFLWNYKFLYRRLVMIPMDKKYAKVIHWHH